MYYLMFPFLEALAIQFQMHHILYSFEELSDADYDIEG